MTRRKKDMSSKQLQDQLLGFATGDDSGFLDEWRDRPVEFFESLGVVFTEKTEAFFLDCINTKITDVAALANRGGGKTYLLAAAGFWLFVFENYDVFALGGSLEQSKKFYKYIRNFLNAADEARDEMESSTKTAAETKRGNWIKVAAASEKAVRGEHAGDPHPGLGNKPHGGCLIRDEVAVMDCDIYDSATSTVNTATPSLIRTASTNHKHGSVMSDIVDDPEGMGYQRLHVWDCFDVAEKCRFKCERCLVEFAGQLHPGYDDWVRGQGKYPESVDAPAGYCEGRARTKKRHGHKRIRQIKKDFVRLGKSKFEIEEMNFGMGVDEYIIPRDWLDTALTGKVRFVAPIHGMPTGLGIDWGYNFNAMTVLQRQVDSKVALLDCRHQVRPGPSAAITNAGCRLIDKHNVNFVGADSNDPYMINDLSIASGHFVEPFVFAQMKEVGASALRRLFEEGNFLIPGRKLGPKDYEFPSEEIRTFFFQLRGWRRDGKGKIVKTDDHYPDSAISIAEKFITGAHDYSSEFLPKANPMPTAGLYEKPPTGAFR